MVVNSQGHVFLEVLKALGDEVLYPERQFELINLLLVREVAEYGGAAPVLEALEVPLKEAEGHLGLGGGGAHDGVEGLRDLGEAGEGGAQTVAVLVVGQTPRHAVKKDADSRGDIFPEWLDVLLVPASVPQQTLVYRNYSITHTSCARADLVTQPPAVLVLPQHVDEGVHVEPGLPGPDPEHHARPEYPLTHVDLPVEPPAIEHPRAPHTRRSVGPVWMEVSYPLLGPVQTDLALSDERVGIDNIINSPRVICHSCSSSSGPRSQCSVAS